MELNNLRAGACLFSQEAAASPPGATALGSSKGMDTPPPPPLVADSSGAQGEVFDQRGLLLYIGSVNPSRARKRLGS